MNYFLAKIHPEDYSISDLEKDKETLWDGVHSYQAIAVIKKMTLNDRILIYHSGGESAIVGLAEVVGEPIDHADIRPSWAVEIRFLQLYEKPILLKSIKETHLFDDWSLVKQGRLSTMEVPRIFLTWMKKLGYSL